LTPLATLSAKAAKSDNEFNAVWISYLEFNDRLRDPATGKLGFTKDRFHAVIDKMYDQVVELGMNAVVVHVRPFGDAFYPSSQFPWSKYISGTQGKDPGFDPLKYMVEAAHDRDLEFHAWINPFRVSSGTTDANSLSKDNRARKWMTSKIDEQKRRVLSFGGSLYYNPSEDWVRHIIRTGVKEIVENYDVDGIHFDDYFYPTLGSNFAKNFDAPEYKLYTNWAKDYGAKAMSIQDWRRDNVNRLIKTVYRTVKNADEDMEFGISPGGFLDYLLMDDRYYCDIETWLSKPGYVDYIAPQLYWSFRHTRFPYDKTLDRWLKLRTNKDVKVYVGIAVYKAGSSEDTEWKNDAKILSKQIEYGRKTKQVDGFIYFRHDFFYRNATKKGVNNLLKVIP
jgi:uncharacterized lipoprotein YddW (UPF0748 family)